MEAIVGRTKRWLEALADHEATKGPTYGTAAAYGSADHEAQDNGPKKHSEALEWLTDKTDKNPNRAHMEAVNETLARYDAKPEVQADTTGEAPGEMCKHEVRGGCWLCHKQGRFLSTEERQSGAT